MLDMLSTDIVLFRSASPSFELNPFVKEMHGTPRVIVFQTVTLAVVFFVLLIFKLKSESVSVLRQHSAFSILTKPGILAGPERLKFLITSSVILFSLSRFTASFSNILGEVVGKNLATAFGDVIGYSSGTTLFVVVVLAILFISLFIMCYLWDNFWFDPS